jgi:amylosucrase
MHRPVIDWEKNKKIAVAGTLENKVFTGTQKLIRIRKSLSVVSDYKNLTWLTPHNIYVAGYLRTYEEQRLYGIFNFSSSTSYLSWLAFKEHGMVPAKLYDHWTEKEFTVGTNYEHLIIEPYSFHLLEPR